MKSRIVFLVVVALFVASPLHAWIHGGGIVIPTADTVCTITTGNCTGIGSGSSLFTAATCNGDAVTDDAVAFRSFNTWLTGTYRVSHAATLVQLTIPTGKVCQFISGDVNVNSWGNNAGRLQTVGYGATINDNGGTGGGFFLGCGSCGVQFNGTASTARLATVSAGSSSITLLDTSKCSLFNNGDYILVAGIDSQGFGDPPNPDRFEWPVIASTASCAGSGVITLTAPLTYTYKSTWPLYNPGNGGQSDQGGPATAYQLNGGWGGAVQAIYGLTIDEQASAVNSNGRDISFFDISCPHSFCVIPSQNQFFRATNLVAPGATIEFDKIVANVVYRNVTLRRVIVQSAEIINWNCTNCTIGPIGVAGTAKTTAFISSNLTDLSLGASCCGASGSFIATNTVISALEFAGASFTGADTRGVWSSTGLTVPANMHISSAANNGSGLIRLTVTSSAGWTTGIVGDGPNSTSCSGTFAVTVIDSTHVDLQGSTFTSTCTGAFGSLPLGSNGTMMVPGANVYFTTGSHGSPTSQVLQVDDLSVGANGETIITFKQNGSAYTGGLPTMPAGTATLSAHPAPSFSCTGCTGAINVVDVNGLPTAPFGSQATRIVTAANSGSATAMPVFGPLTELDMTVTAACSGASNVGFEQTMFTATLGASSFGSWNPTANALIASATPRVVTPTTSSGAQSGDSLVTPGANTIILTGQSLPFYSAVGNCGSASTTVTLKTNQGVVYP